jgi:hypothetical protein
VRTATIAIESRTDREMMTALAALWGFGLVVAIGLAVDCPDTRAFLVEGAVTDVGPGEWLTTVRAP